MSKCLYCGEKGVDHRHYAGCQGLKEGNTESCRAGVRRSQIENKVLEFCKEGAGENDVKLDSQLDHLGFDAWDKAVIAENLEDTYKIEIPQDVAEKWKSVQDVVNTVISYQ